MMQYDAIPRNLIIFVGGLKLLVVTVNQESGAAVLLGEGHGETY